MAEKKIGTKNVTKVFGLEPQDADSFRLALEIMGRVSFRGNSRSCFFSMLILEMSIGDLRHVLSMQWEIGVWS